METENDDNEPPLELGSAGPSHEHSRKCCDFTPQSLVCISHALSAWGDRMWEFAVALYLVELTPGSLRLTAIFQLTRTLCVIFLGPFVGTWVDANPRLRVAQLSLVSQNLAVAASALLLLLVLSVKLPYAAFVVMVILVIVVACFSVLAGIATKIAIEKDWVVVIAGHDKDLLAATNSIMRRIDLVCKILAPAVVGQVMTYVSKVAGVILIASWNVGSVFLEYYMLLRVFRRVPSLAHRRIDKKRKKEQETASNEENEEPGGSREMMNAMEGAEDDEEGDTDTLVPQTAIRRPHPAQKLGIIQRLRNKVITFKEGFRIYMRQSVARPGMSLAMLYFTVISFGSITTAYLYTQHMTESLLSILRGVGSVFGILATFAFPRLRSRVGLVRSGLFSMSAQFSCILLCFFAVFAPGSPFFLLPDSWRYHGNVIVQNTTRTVAIGNCTLAGVTPSPNASSIKNGFMLGINENNTAADKSITPTSSLPTLPQFNINSTNTVQSTHSTPGLPATSLPKPFIHVSPKPSIHVSPTSRAFHPTVSPTTYQQNCSSHPQDVVKKTFNFSYVSVILLLTGIITSRFGLWLSDLTITQLQQETVPEEERGRVGAMQKSLNSVTDMLMYVFVISLPKPEEFGLMALMSVAAVGLAGLTYASFSYKVRGHLFHFNQIRGCSSWIKPAHRSGSRRGQAASQDSLGNDDDEEQMLSTMNENFKY